MAAEAKYGILKPLEFKQASGSNLAAYLYYLYDKIYQDYLSGCPKFKTLIQLHLLKSIAVWCQKCWLHAPYLPRIESISQKKPCHDAFFDPKPEIQIFLGNNSGMNFQQLEAPFRLDRNLVTKKMVFLVLSMFFPSADDVFFWSWEMLNQVCPCMPLNWQNVV